MECPNHDEHVAATTLRDCRPRLELFLGRPLLILVDIYLPLLHVLPTDLAEDTSERGARPEKMVARLPNGTAVPLYNSLLTIGVAIADANL